MGQGCCLPQFDGCLFVRPRSLLSLLVSSMGSPRVIDLGSRYLFLWAKPRGALIGEGEEGCSDEYIAMKKKDDASQPSPFDDSQEIM